MIGDFERFGWFTGERRERGVLGLWRLVVQGEGRGEGCLLG